MTPIPLCRVSAATVSPHSPVSQPVTPGYTFPPLTNSRSLPSLHPATNTPRRHDLFVSLRAEPDQTDTFRGAAPSLRAPDTAASLPILTPFVTPRPPELHFYSGRHVRARVRLHLRRVTGNNNTEIGEGRESRWRHQAETTDLATESGGKGRGEPNQDDDRCERRIFFFWQNVNT